MAPGGFARQPDGSVIVALTVPSPDGEGTRVRVLVHAANRPRALTRLRNLGLRAVYLRDNTEPPTPDEITAVLHHPDGLLWRSCRRQGTASWQPIGKLLRPVTSGGAPPGSGTYTAATRRHSGRVVPPRRLPVAEAFHPRLCG